MSSWKNIDLESLFFGKDPFVKYTRVDYILLLVMFGLTTAWVPWGLQRIPGFGSENGWFTPVCFIVCSVAGCAYFWQLRENFIVRILTPFIFLMIGVFLYLYAFINHSDEKLLPGIIGLNMGIWSLVRLVVLRNRGQVLT